MARDNEKAVQGGHPVRLARIMSIMIFIVILADLEGVYNEHAL